MATPDLSYDIRRERKKMKNGKKKTNRARGSSFFSDTRPLLITLSTLIA